MRLVDIGAAKGNEGKGSGENIWRERRVTMGI